MIRHRVEEIKPFIAELNWSKLCFCMIAMVMLGGCSNDKLGTDKIEAQDAKGPIPPLTTPPEIQKPKNELVRTDVKQASSSALNGLDIPIYPGAEPASSANDIIAANKSYGVVLGVFETTDSFDKVVDYYRTQYPSPGKSSLPVSTRNEWLDDKTGVKRIVRITVTDTTKGDGLKTIEISAKKNKTQINLMRVSSAKLSGLASDGTTLHN